VSLIAHYSTCSPRIKGEPGSVGSIVHMKWNCTETILWC
jgi:hypothetical protein